MRHLRGFLEQYGPLLRNRNFRRIILAGLISSVGSKISYFALLRKVYVISGGQITDLGFLAIVEMVPGMLLGPFAGVLVDRFRRKTIMLACDALNGLVILSLIFVQDLWLIYVVAGLSSLITTFRFPAQRALEPNLVERSQIVLLNSFNASTTSLIQVIGSALGGATVGFLGARTAFVIDAATFWVSALLITGLVIRETHMLQEAAEKAEEAAGGVVARQWRQFMRGASVLGENLKVRVVFLIEVFLMFAMSMQGTLIYFFLREGLQLGDKAEQYWGYLLSGLGIGGVVGSIILGVVIKRYANRIKLFLNVLLCDAAGLAGFLLSPFFPLSFVLFSSLGVIGAAHQIIINTILQEEVEDAKRGRVFSLLGIVAGPVSALSIFVGTVGAEYITARNVLLLAAVCEVAIALGIRLTSVYRRLEATGAETPAAGSPAA